MLQSDFKVVYVSQTQVRFVYFCVQTIDLDRYTTMDVDETGDRTFLRRIVPGNFEEVLRAQRETFITIP